MAETPTNNRGYVGIKTTAPKDLGSQFPTTLDDLLVAVDGDMQAALDYAAAAQSTANSASSTAGTASAAIAALPTTYQPLSTTTTVKTANYTAATGEIVRVDASAGSVIVTLPSSMMRGQQVCVRIIALTSPNTVTVDANGGNFDTSTGPTTKVFTIAGAGIFVADGSGVISEVSDHKPLSVLDARYLKINEAPPAFETYVTGVTYATGKTVTGPDHGLYAKNAGAQTLGAFVRSEWTAMHSVNKLNARDFGCLGTGESFDSTPGHLAVNAAASAFSAFNGGKVMAIDYPAGNYKFYDGVVMYDGMSWEGVGNGLYSTGTLMQSSAHFLKWNSTSRVKGLQLKNIKFFGQPTLAPSTEFTVINVTDAVSTSGSKVVTSPSGQFTGASKGRSYVSTAFPAGTQIDVFTDANTMTLTNNPVTPGSGQTVAIGQRNGGPFSYTLFDPAGFSGKTLWFPIIRDCGFEYLTTIKVNLLGGELFSGNAQMLHFDKHILELYGYDYNISPYGPYYMGQDRQAAGQPMMKFLNGSNIKIMDIFPTANVGQTRIIEATNIEGLVLAGCRLDGYDTGATSSYPMTGAAAYFSGCTGVTIEGGTRVQGAMGGPALDGVNPTDPGALTFNNCEHVSVQAAYRRLKSGNPTIARKGTFSDFNVNGCHYNTEDGVGVWMDNGAIVVAPTIPTGTIWDERPTPGPAGPEAFDLTTFLPYSSGTTYSAGPPADVVTTATGSYYAVQSGNVGNNPDTDNGTWWKKIALNGTSSTNYAGRLGTGADGAVALDGTNTYSFLSKSGSIYTQTRNMHSATLVLSSGVTLKTAGFLTFCQGIPVIPSGATVDLSGTAGTAAGVAGAGGGSSNVLLAGGAGGAGNTGAGSTAGSGGMGGSSGSGGGTGSGGSGGAAGAATTSAALLDRIQDPTPILEGGFWNSASAKYPGGGGGGGGGGGDGTNKGGGGGGGGGPWALFARGLTLNGAITAKGGNGGTPTVGNCGGGSAGGGGLIALYLLQARTGSGTIDVTAGTPGIGVGTGTTPSAPVNGNLVEVIIS